MKTKILGSFDIYINDGNYGNIYPAKELFLYSGIPFISATDFSGREFNYDGIKFIGDELHFNVLKKGHLKLNDVLIVVRGNGIGKVGFFKDEIGECNINAQLAFIRTNPHDLNPAFLYYLFSSNQYLKLIKKFGSGSAQPQLPINRLKMVPVICRDIKEQNEIAKVLSDLDAKIELNNKINADLEAMAKLIYDYWFVQFDFPISAEQAAAMGKPELKAKPYKSSGGKMVYNEELKREIPEGWEVGCLSNLFILNPTLSIKKGEVSSYIDMNALPESGYMTKPIKKKEFSGGMKFQNGDVVVARITPCLENGKTAMISLLDDDEVGFGSTEFIVLRGKGFDLRSFAACISRSISFRHYAISKMTGTSGRKRVNHSAIGEFKMALPSKKLLIAFEKKIKPFFNQSTLNTKQNQQLASLRDWLLPMLMNGQVTVGEAEEKVGELGMVAEPASEYKIKNE